MSHLTANKKLVNRMNRLQGQMAAAQKAIFDESISCIEVLQQIAAIKGAIEGVMGELIEEHLKEHVLSDEYDQEELEKFLKLLRKYN